MKCLTLSLSHLAPWVHNLELTLIPLPCYSKPLKILIQLHLLADPWSVHYLWNTWSESMQQRMAKLWKFTDSLLSGCSVDKRKAIKQHSIPKGDSCICYQRCSSLHGISCHFLNESAYREGIGSGGSCSFSRLWCHCKRSGHNHFPGLQQSSLQWLSHSRPAIILVKTPS